MRIEMSAEMGKVISQKSDYDEVGFDDDDVDADEGDVDDDDEDRDVGRNGESNINRDFQDIALEAKHSVRWST